MRNRYSLFGNAMEANEAAKEDAAEDFQEFCEHPGTVVKVIERLIKQAFDCLTQIFFSIVSGENDANFCF